MSKKAGLHVILDAMEHIRDDEEGMMFHRMGNYFSPNRKGNFPGCATITYEGVWGSYSPTTAEISIFFNKDGQAAVMRKDLNNKYISNISLEQAVNEQLADFIGKVAPERVEELNDKVAELKHRPEQTAVTTQNNAPRNHRGLRKFLRFGR